MQNDNHTRELSYFVSGSERRHAKIPRRSQQNRRHRIRFESLISDCRTGFARRREDEEGFEEFESLYLEKTDQSQSRK